MFFRHYTQSLCTATFKQSTFFYAQLEEQVKQLQKGVTHIGVGTPGRISALIDRGTVSVMLIRFFTIYK